MLQHPVKLSLVAMIRFLWRQSAVPEKYNWKSFGIGTKKEEKKGRLIELTQEESVIFLRVKMSDLNKRSAVIERYMESAKKNGVHECIAWPGAWSWFSSLRSQIVACLGYKRKKKKKRIPLRRLLFGTSNVQFWSISKTSQFHDTYQVLVWWGGDVLKT